MKKHLAIVALALLGSSTLSTNAFGDWKAGVGRRTITPQQPMWMSGYASRKAPADGTLHQLWVKSLVLTDESDSSFVLVTLDLVGVGRPLSKRVCDRIQKTHDIDRSQICIATSHTHCGPVVGRNLSAMYFLNGEQAKRVDDYERWLENEIVKSVDDAFRLRFEANVEYGLGKATFAVNRRNNREPDVIKLRAEGKALVGPFDHDVPVFRVSDDSGKVRAVLFGYACHATTLSFQFWNGDWPGFGQIEIEKRHPGVTAMFFAGCGADQNPLPRRKVEYAEGYGKQIADAVDRVFSKPLQKMESKVVANYAEVPLKFAKIPDKEQLSKTTESSNRYEVSRAKRLLSQLESAGKIESTYPYPVQTWQMGDVKFVMLGGEVVVDFSLRLKNELEGSVVVGAYMNDVMAYIPSVRVLKEGGYEGGGAMVYYGLPSPWVESVEDDIVNEVKRQLTANPTVPVVAK